MVEEFDLSSQGATHTCALVPAGGSTFLAVGNRLPMEVPLCGACERNGGSMDRSSWPGAWMGCLARHGRHVRRRCGLVERHPVCGRSKGCPLTPQQRCCWSSPTMANPLVGGPWRRLPIPTWSFRPSRAGPAWCGLVRYLDIGRRHIGCHVWQIGAQP